MAGKAEPVLPRREPGWYQDHEGWRLTFSDGETLDLYGPSDAQNLFYRHYTAQCRARTGAFTHQDTLALYGRLRELVTTEELFGEPYYLARPGNFGRR